MIRGTGKIWYLWGIYLQWRDMKVLGLGLNMGPNELIWKSEMAWKLFWNLSLEIVRIEPVAQLSG